MEYVDWQRGDGDAVVDGQLVSWSVDVARKLAVNAMLLAGAVETPATKPESGE